MNRRRAERYPRLIKPRISLRKHTDLLPKECSLKDSDPIIGPPLLRLREDLDSVRSLHPRTCASIAPTRSHGRNLKTDSSRLLLGTRDPGRRESSVMITIAVPSGRGAQHLQRDRLAAAAGQPRVGEQSCSPESTPPWFRSHHLRVQRLAARRLDRNEAVPRIRTDWTGFLDDDDALTPDYVRRWRVERSEVDVVRDA
jgi:hypothetical protein